MPERRFSKVPWLGPEDLQPFGDPEVTIHRGRTVAHCLRIPIPFGKDSDAVLVITDDTLTQRMCAAIEGGDLA